MGTIASLGYAWDRKADFLAESLEESGLRGRHVSQDVNPRADLCRGDFRLLHYHQLLRLHKTAGLHPI
jgi:hypothetical protein